MEPGFPLLTPFLAARDLDKNNPNLQGDEKDEKCPKCGSDMKDPRELKDKKMGR